MDLIDVLSVINTRHFYNYFEIFIFRELHREEYKKSGFLLIKKEDDIVFPPGGKSSNWFTLTYVNVTNLMPKGKEGMVTLTEGGIGHQNVTLHLESQRGEGYHFLVVVRGKNSELTDVSVQTKQ